MRSDEDGTLLVRLAQELSEGSSFTVHYISTTPQQCDAIFAADSAQEPEVTSLESHFLSVSIKPNDKIIQVFALEILVYTTPTLATLFVSKADSTGYLYLLDLTAGGTSPFRTITKVFIQWLLENHTKPNTPTLLSLFARAQNQYLFPGSIENDRKHVLDDRGLIKWWCKVVDSLLCPTKDGEREDGIAGFSRQGFLRVPGYDALSTRAFFPKNGASAPRSEQLWQVGDPLRELRPADLPERCLVPRFPDDPKARFLLDLDDELPQVEVTVPAPTREKSSVTRLEQSGKWRSVRSLDQFWEMMSFRQECSAGRLVGFLWALYSPHKYGVGKERMKQDDEVDRIANGIADEVANKMADKMADEMANHMADKMADEMANKMADEMADEMANEMADNMANGKAAKTDEKVDEMSRASDICSLPTPASSQARGDGEITPASPARVKLSLDLGTPQTAFREGMESKMRQTLSQQTLPVSKVDAANEVIAPLRGPVPVEVKLSPKQYDEAVEFLLQLDYADVDVAAYSTAKWIDRVGEKGGRQTWGAQVTGENPARKSSPLRSPPESTPAVLDLGLIRKKKRPLSVDHSDVPQEGAVKVLSAGLIRKKAKQTTPN